VGKMPFPYVVDFLDYLRRYPLVDELIAADLGYKPPERKDVPQQKPPASSSTNPLEIQFMVARSPGGRTLTLDHLPLWMQASLDLARKSLKADLN
jgi:hypothetical protein